MVKADEATNPVHRGLLGTEAVMFEPNFVADLIQQLGRLTPRNLRGTYFVR